MATHSIDANAIELAPGCLDADPCAAMTRLDGFAGSNIRNALVARRGKLVFENDRRGTSQYRPKRMPDMVVCFSQRPLAEAVRTHP
jgi:hypothetical protein